jgi:hypothetical protein
MDDELRVNPRTPRHHFLVFFSPHSFAFGEVNMCVYAYVRLIVPGAS